VKTIESTVDVAAPPEAVFDLIHDYERRLEWDPFLCEARLLDGAHAAGVGVRALCRARTRSGGGAMETVYVSYQRPAVAAVRMTRGPFYLAEFAASLRQLPLPGGSTRVSYKFNLAGRPAWLRPLMEPVLAMVFRRETRRRLAALRRFLEADARN
jgi:hypothetical protein